MRFAPRISVQTRLTMAFFVAIGLTWALSLLTLRFFLEQDIQRINREMSARNRPGSIRVEGPMGRLYYPPPPGGEPGPSEGQVQGRPDGPPPAGPGGPPPGGPPGPDGGPRGPRRGLPPPFAKGMQAVAPIAVVVSLLAGWWLSRRFTRRLTALAEGSRAFHERQFGHRIQVPGNDEFADVAATLNEMAQEVGAQIRTLEDDAQRRRQVLADVAHELRSPVATMQAMAAAMRDGVAEEPARRGEAIAFMMDSAGRMKRLVDDLLEVARLDLREIPLVRAPVDLRALAEDAAGMHRIAARDAGLELLPVEGDGPVEVEVDALRLSQVLDNLLENAITYAGRGAEIRVRVTAEPPGIIVQDNGAGIAPEHLPFIFDPFYRADAARSPGSNHSGLGLRIARGLVEAHGGTLTLESTQGQGTTATITLCPVRVSEAS